MPPQNNNPDVQQNTYSQPTGNYSQPGGDSYTNNYSQPGGDAYNNYNQPAGVPYGNYGQPPAGEEPGRGLAIGSLVCGIISIVCWFFGSFAFIGLVTGIVGLILSSKAKKEGNESGMRKGGFVCSLIGLIGSAIIFVACVACLGALGAAAGASGDLEELEDVLNSLQ